MSRFLGAVLVLVLAACGSAGEEPGATTTSTTGAQASTTVTAGDQATTTAAETTTSTTTTTPGPGPTEIVITVVGGSVDRVERFAVPLDGEVRLVVTADVTDEVHVHGYDLHADLIPGVAGTLEFSATRFGIFEIELEEAGLLIAELQVAP